MYIGRDLTQGNYIKIDDLQSSFNGNTKTFNLTTGGNAFTPGSANVLLVSLGGVIQEPIESYTVTNDQITFSNPPRTSTSIFIIALSACRYRYTCGNSYCNQVSRSFLHILVLVDLHDRYRQCYRDSW